MLYNMKLLWQLRYLKVPCYYKHNFFTVYILTLVAECLQVTKSDGQTTKSLAFISQSTRGHVIRLNFIFRRQQQLLSERFFDNRCTCTLILNLVTCLISKKSGELFLLNFDHIYA
jgi:hypothetical protein